MYGGLFGDLPSTKKDASKGSNGSGNGNNGDDGKTSRGSGSSARGTTTGTADSPSKPKQASASFFAPPRQASSKNASKNLLQMVGKSGTTMAFVPAAALKAKRKKTVSVSEGGSNNNSSSNNSSSNNNSNNDNPKRIRSSSTGTDHPSSSFAVVATTTTTTTTRISSSDRDDRAKEVVDIHGTGVTANIDATTNATTNPFSPVAPGGPLSDSEAEETITDPYDPYVPNDLLDHWERLAAKKQREHLERETREALEQQKAMRRRLEEERSELLQRATATSTATVGIGKGRGRGLSNLPAWLVERQRAGGEGPSSPTAAAAAVGDRSPAFGAMGRGRGRGVSNLPAWLVERQRQQQQQDASANGQ